MYACVFALVLFKIIQVHVHTQVVNMCFALHEVDRLQQTQSAVKGFSALSSSFSSDSSSARIQNNQISKQNSNLHKFSSDQSHVRSKLSIKETKHGAFQNGGSLNAVEAYVSQIQDFLREHLGYCVAASKSTVTNAGTGVFARGE